MPYPSQSAAWADVAAAVRARLAGGLGLDPAYVRVVASDSYDPSLIAEPRFLFLRYYGPRPRTDAGAGRGATPVARRVRTYLYLRTSADPVAEDGGALLDPTFGLSAYEEAVYGLLVNFWPLTPDGAAALTLEPLHPLDAAGGPPERAPENDVGLVRAALDFDVTYLLRVLAADPAP